MNTVKKFYEALASDSALRERARAMDEKYKNAPPDGTGVAGKIVAFAKSEGYDFTAEQLTAYTNDTGKELSDDEISAVAGGLYSVCGCAQTGSGVIDGTDEEYEEWAPYTCMFGGIVTKGTLENNPLKKKPS